MANPEWLTEYEQQGKNVYRRAVKLEKWSFVNVQKFFL
jgi:hypothetical protein